MENEELEPVDVLMDQLRAFAQAAIESIPSLVLAVLALFATWLIVRILRSAVGSVMERAGTRKALIRLATNLVGIASWIVGTAVAITIIFPSITPANLIAGLGLTGVAVGFAFKDVFENFLAGVIILAREKMRIGDVIECEGVFGRIEDIKIRETHVRDTNGELVIVPNAFLFSNPVDIQTDQDLKRQELVVGVDYDADMRRAKEALMSALKSCDTIDESRGVEVACVSFGGSSIDFKLLWWTDSQPKAQRASYDQIAFAVKDALDDAEIGIPFPQTTLSFREEAYPLRLQRESPEGRDHAVNGSKPS